MDLKNRNIDAKRFLINIKSKFILKKIFALIQYSKSLELIRYNKKLQIRLQIELNDYKEYLKTEIEIIPTCILNDKLINIKDNDESYFHFYFNDEKEGKKINELNLLCFIHKIKIIIEYEVKTYNRLFIGCDYIKKLKFIKFNRKDI